MVEIPNYKFVGKNRPTKKGGGVGFLVHNKLYYKVRDDININCESDLEYVFIELKARKRNLIKGSLYRPPHTREKDFLRDYKELVQTLKQEKDKEIVLGMDHNMDLLKASKHANTQDFLDYNVEMDLLPVIIKPSRITKNSATLIDSIFISRMLQQEFSSCLIISDLSDHLPAVVTLTGVQQEKRESIVISYGNITEENITAVEEDLKGYNWEDIMYNMNTNEAFSTYHKILLDSIQQHMPEKTLEMSREKMESIRAMDNKGY